MRLDAQQLEHAAPAHQRRVERLALDEAHAALEQLRPVLRVARPRHDRELREVLARQVHQREVALDVVDRHHQHLGLAGTGHAQQVEPRGVAVVHLPAEAPRRLHLIGADVEHGGAASAGEQQAPDDLPVAAEAGDDHRRALRRFDAVLRRFPACAPADARPTSGRSPAAAAASAASTTPPPPPAATPPRRSMARACVRGLEDDEAELAALREQHHEHRAARPAGSASRAPSPTAPAPSTTGTRRPGRRSVPDAASPRGSRCPCPPR